MKKLIFLICAVIGLGVSTAAFPEMELLRSSSPGGLGVHSRQARDPISWNVYQVVGKIEALDLREGRLALRQKNYQTREEEVITYNINDQRTFVTDPSDKQFLKLTDLKEGQLIGVQYVTTPNGYDAQNIIVSPDFMNLNWVYGEVVTVQPGTNTLVIKEITPDWPQGETALFVVHPTDTYIAFPSRQEFRGLSSLSTGDRVQIAYTEKDNRRLARSIIIEPRYQTAQPSSAQQLNGWISGTVESLDFSSGTMVLRTIQADSPNVETKQLLVHPKNTNVSQPGFGIRRLEDLQPGQLVSVQCTTVNGEQFAHDIVIQQR